MSEEFTPEEIQELENPTPEVQPESQPQAELPKPTEKELQSMVKELKLKVNGKEYVEKIDLSDEQRLIKALQMEKMATEATQKASAREKELLAMNEQLDQFFNLLKNDPLSVLLNPELGVNAEELANLILTRQAEEDAKTPEQKALEEERQAKKALQDRIAELEKKEEEKRQEAERLKHEQIKNEFERDVTDKINKAIDSGELPQSAYVISKFGQLLNVAFENQLDVDPNDLIPIVKEAYLRDMKDMIGKLPDNVIEEMVTSERIKGIRNKKIQSLREMTQKQNNSLKSVEETSQKVVSDKAIRKGDFFKKLGDW